MADERMQPETGDESDLEAVLAARRGPAQVRPLGSLGVPRSVDAQGLAAETPKWGRVLAIPLYVLAMLALAVGVFVVGHPVVGVAIVLIAVVPAVGVVMLANARLPQLLGSAATHEREGAAEVPGLGGPVPLAANPELGLWLGARRETLAAWAPTLIEEELDTLVRNRDAEAAKTQAWRAELGEPERVEVTATDGVRLRARVMPSGRTEEGDGGLWVVLLHGYRGSWRDGLLHARHYAERGFNVLLPDLRCHGESGGAWVGLGLLDRDDLVTWCSWIVLSAGSNARIVLHGMGMGAAAALLASADEGLPSQVRACVADSAYSDAWNVAVRLLGGSDGRQSAHPMIDLMRLSLRLREGGYDVALARPEAAVFVSRVPVLLLQGDQDTVVPPYMARRLSEACGGAAAGEDHGLVMIEGAGHGEAALADPVGYYWRVRTFEDRYL